MYDRHSVRLLLVHSLPAIADRHGARLPLILARSGLAAEEVDWDRHVATRAQVCAMMQGLAQLSGDATIGIQMAEETDTRRLGPFGASVHVGRSLRECLTLQLRYMPWLQRGVDISLSDDGNRASWVHRTPGSDPALARYLNEGIAAFVVRLVRTVTGEPEARVQVTLPHRPQVPVQHYEDMLGCAVSFSPGTDMVVRFDSRLLDLPNLLAGHPVRSADVAPPDAPRPPDIELDGERLLRILHRQFEAAALLGKLSVLDACATLGLSPRTLQRRLAAQGTTFEAEVDCWRHHTARGLLSDPGQKVGVVAAQLGYSDPAHFIRAFQRWEGMPPTGFRAAQGQ